MLFAVLNDVVTKTEIFNFLKKIQSFFYFWTRFGKIKQIRKSTKFWRKTNKIIFGCNIIYNMNKHMYTLIFSCRAYFDQFVRPITTSILVLSAWIRETWNFRIRLTNVAKTFWSSNGLSNVRGERYGRFDPCIEGFGRFWHVFGILTAPLCI